MFSAINRKVKRMVLRQQKNRPVVRISDTTLRDGCQTPGVRLTADEKVIIAKALAEAGVHSIDCGFPAANQTEFDAIQRIGREVKGPLLSAHARTKVDDVKIAAEALSGVTPLKRAVTVFIGVSPIHREHKHDMSKAQIIKTIVDTIEAAGSHFEIISFGPEDASRTEADFLHEVYKEAIAAGALSVGYTDTVGILTPAKCADAIKSIQDNVPNINDAMLGVHFHNDLGLATANSLAAVEAGANIVQGTINGIGERAGNAAIEEVVLTLVLHNDQYKKKVGVDPSRLFGLSQLVSRLTGFHPPANKAAVGRNIFRTETGVHQDAVLKNVHTYMPFPPELVGAGPVEVVLGPNSGRSAVKHHMEAVGIEPTEEHVKMILGYLKNEAHTPEENEEVQAFLSRVQKFMTADEYESQSQPLHQSK